MIGKALSIKNFIRQPNRYSFRVSAPLFRGLLLAVLAVASLTGCGVAHVKTGGQGENIYEYNKVAKGEVKVYSREAAAADNDALQVKLRNWEAQADRALDRYVTDLRPLMAKAPEKGPSKVLVVDLDVEVTYGNRALRYWVGFGAGKGGVNSVLTIKDSQSGAEKFVAYGDSDLSVGAFGGDIGSVFESNLEELLQQTPKRSATVATGS